MTKEKNNIEVKRINANIPVKLAKRVEDYANENMLNLTSAYITLLNQALNSYEITKAMPMYTQLLQNQNLSKIINLSKEIDNDDLVKSNQFLANLTPEQLNNLINQDNIKKND